MSGLLPSTSEDPRRGHVVPLVPEKLLPYNGVSLAEEASVEEDGGLEHHPGPTVAVALLAGNLRIRESSHGFIVSPRFDLAIAAKKAQVKHAE